jgi:glycosyltransferase involved in cell wall biosynthesis
MVRDEDDVIGYTISHLLGEGVDHVIVADNLSTDYTRAILDGFGPSVEVIDDPDPRMLQSAKTTRLARMASERGFDWILPCDADELFYAESGTLADWFAACTFDVACAHVWDHIATDADDQAELNPWRRITRRRKFPQRLYKVAFRADSGAIVHEGNHDVDRLGFRTTGIYARHVQYRSLDQMARKVRQGKAGLEAASMHAMHGTHWRELGALDDAELLVRWRELSDEPDLIEDPAPYRGAL